MTCLKKEEFNFRKFQVQTMKDKFTIFDQKPTLETEKRFLIHSGGFGYNKETTHKYYWMMFFKKENIDLKWANYKYLFSTGKLPNIYMLSCSTSFIETYTDNRTVHDSDNYVINFFFKIDKPRYSLDEKVIFQKEIGNQIINSDNCDKCLNKFIYCKSSLIRTKKDSTDTDKKNISYKPKLECKLPIQKEEEQPIYM